MKHYLPLILLLLTASLSFAQSKDYKDISPVKRQIVSTNYIEIYPNPTTAYFSVTEVQEAKQILIFNLAGRKMKLFQDVAKDKRYFVGDLPKGIFLVQMIDGKGKIITTRRISKR